MSIQAAAKIAGNVTLSNRVVLALGVAMVIATPSLFADDTVVDLHFAYRNTPPSAVHGSVILVSRDKPPVTRSFELQQGGLTSVQAPADSVWDVAVRAEGWWSPGGELTVPKERATFEIPLWRTGQLRGRFKVHDRTTELPKAFEIHLESPPLLSLAPDLPAGTTIQCPIEENGRWSCGVPAGTRDLAFRTVIFTPVYRWGVAIASEAPLDLGVLVLKKGASLLAWLSRQALASAEAPVTARLLRQIATSEPSETGARLRVPVAEATFDSYGAVQLAPLPEGTYVLEVAAKGWATARVAGVEVREGSELVLRRAIDLERPLTLRLTIVPQAHPDGSPWMVEVARESDFTSGLDPMQAARKRTGADGLVVLKNQAPGTFRVRVEDRAGNALVSRSIRVGSQQDADHLVEVEPRVVRGSVLQGETPLPATLWFGGRDGDVRVKTTTDDDGKFETMLAPGNDWRVTVNSKDGRIDTTLWAHVADDEVTIVVPSTRINGWVVDGEGRRVPDALVTAVADQAASLSTHTGDDGAFALSGTPVGRVRLMARDPRSRAMSPAIPIDVHADVERTGIELRLSESRTIDAELTDVRGPIAGARVSLWAILGSNADRRVAVTDLAGRCRFEVPVDATRARVVVAAPGRVMQVFEAELGDSLSFLIEAVGGTLSVTSLPSQPLAIVAGTVFVPIAEYREWARGQGVIADPAHLVVPHLAPGPYRVCTRTPAQDLCKSGVLAPGGTLSLDLTE